MENSKKKAYEYVIGIDFGHGETSAAICPLQWETPIEQLEPAKDLEMGGNKKVIPSAITILENGDAHIGDSAFHSDILQKANVNVCFKKAPSDINGKGEMLMIRYMKEVYRRIRENASGILTDENHLVYIATPSGWDKPTQDLYFKMAKEAGFPIGGLTKESRAAFIRAQQDVTSGIKRNIEKGAIVFDMGSSTLDFTYMNGQNDNQLIDHGYDCGASFIEKSIYQNLKEKNSFIKKFEEKYPQRVSWLLFEARNIKEKVYFDTSLPAQKKVDFDDIAAGDEELEDERIKILFRPGELNRLLDEIGYLKEIENAMHSFKRDYIQNAPIYGVFLTGGASRMDFIKPMVSKCWDLSESQIYRDQDPSLTISQGVAEVARMDLRTAGMDEGLEEVINKLQQSDKVYATFIEKFVYALWDRITDDVSVSVTSFRDSSSDHSLFDLEYDISDSVQSGVENITKNISLFIEEAIAENTIEIRQKVENIITHYSKQGLNVQMPEIQSIDIEIQDINLTAVLKELSDKIAEESTNWTGVITGVAIGGTIALILGGPLAWIIGGAAWLGGLFFGESESEEEKKRNAMVKNLNLNERQEVVNSINEKWDGIQEDIERTIRNSITRNRNIKESINKVSYQLLQSYKDNLKRARILID